MKADDRINILVVDDVPEKLIAIEAILEDLGQNIVSVGSGREALRRLLYQDFALILLDVNMPEMDGFETAAMIRQRKKSEHTPIIFITGFSDETHVSRGYSLGAVDYILTPVVPEVLRAKVAVFVDLYRKTELVKRQAEQQVAIAHEQAARAAAEAATKRSAFLADASTILATSLDYDATLAHSARLPIPSLADISVLRMAGANRTNPAQVACADDQIEAALHSASACPFGSVLDACSRHVMQTGKTERLAPSFLGESPAGGPDAGNGAAPAPRIAAALVLPLIARGKVLGTLSLARTREGSVYAPLDVSLAEDLAGRIAIAIDNANLFREVQEGDRRKDEFLATLSHELRNPIAAISNALQCLEVGADSQALVDEARSILKRQVQHVIRLVDDLLDVSRITRGKIRLRAETVELKSMIDRAVSGVRPLVAARGHDLSVSLPETAVYLKGDPTRLEQVVGNLLHNAAKYTDPGGRIEMAAELEGEQVAIRVKDTGAGISADLLPKIFDLFAQGDRTLDHSQGGLGIGLTLVRNLVTLHGGEVSAASRGPGQGSEFVVRLPVVVPVDKEDAPADSAPANGAATNGHGRRVVLVDDNVDLGTMTAVLLRSLGHDVHLCHDGPAALRAVDAVQPEVMLIDIGLPGMSGHEVARAIRQRPGSDELLLVAMTGYGQAEDRRRSLDAGFDVHLVKPVGLRALEELLRASQPAAGAT
ncbi:MAG TPA: response regulator [Pirellulales bacterium]|jgi:signal transduction histidine kinase/DNA-binding response OmpR family regulator|nr:response regulator [Pirellulales bacterium]